MDKNLASYASNAYALAQVRRFWLKFKNFV